LANTKSAIKRIRQSERRRVHNRAIITRTRTYLKKARTALASNQPAPQTEATLKEAMSALDRAVTKGTLHRNNAARRKSRLMQQFQEKTKGEVVA
jgi:small subunit ribosomal protein S20